jgi:hypothetical protein
MTSLPETSTPPGHQVQVSSRRQSTRRPFEVIMAACDLINPHAEDVGGNFIHVGDAAWARLCRVRKKARQGA